MSLLNAALKGLLAWSISDYQHYEATRPKSARIEVAPGLVPNLWWTTGVSAVIFAVAVIVAWLVLRRIPSFWTRVAAVFLGLFVAIVVASLKGL